jgi:outer membrane protein assembly factor BamB
LLVLNGNSDSLSEIDASTGALVRVISSPYQFKGPDAMAVAGAKLFVMNGSGNSLTEINASTGALVRVISGPAYSLYDPSAVAVAGDDLFVASDPRNGLDPGSLTEINASTGALVRIISGPAYQFNGPEALAVAGDDLFVANEPVDGLDPGSLTEIDASTGALVRIISGAAYQFHGPNALVVASDNLFVVDGDIGPLTEIDAATGRMVRVIRSTDPADGPGELTAAGDDVFLANWGDSLTEINARTGRLIRVVSDRWQCVFGLLCPNYQFNQPEALAVAGEDLFVGNNPSNANDPHGTHSVTEINASTGALERVISGPAYQFNGPDAMTTAGLHLFVANFNSNSLTELQLPGRAP